MKYIIELSNYTEASDTSGVPVIIYKGSKIKNAKACFDSLKKQLTHSNQFLCLSFLGEKEGKTIEIDYHHFRE